MEESAALDDDPRLHRFFPILTIGDPENMVQWEVAVGYIAGVQADLLIGYSDKQGEWVVIEENRNNANFEHSENELAYWIIENNDVPAVDVVGYESSDPDYPNLG
jgi:hypothetical protein